MSVMRRTSPKLIPEFKVINFDKSLEFYTKLAGFKVLYDRPEERFAMLDRDGAMLMIEVIEEGDRWQVGKREYPLGQGINFQIEVTGVQELYNNLKKANYPIFYEMEEKWYRKDDTEVGNKQFLVQDPDGYVLRFFEDLGSRSVQK